MKKLLLLPILSILFFGCATMSSLSFDEKEAMQTRIYNGGYDDIFNAVFNVLDKPRIFVFNIIDKPNGYIATDWTSAEQAFGSMNRYKMTARIIKIDDISTRVNLKIISEIRYDGFIVPSPDWQDNTENLFVDDISDLYSKTFNAIQKYCNDNKAIK
jgi:hypothetical protein